MGWFFFGFGALAAASLAGQPGGASRASAQAADRSRVKRRKPYIAIQIGAVSFADEGTEKVLDILQEKASVNTLWLNTYT